jgi:hypothetical protein
MLDVVALQADLNALHAQGIKSHMPYVFNDTLVCCLNDNAVTIDGERIWKSHIWNRATHNFDQFNTGLDALAIECAPQMRVGADGLFYFSIVVTNNRERGLFGFTGQSLSSIQNTTVARTNQAGFLLATTRFTTDKFVVRGNETPAGLCADLLRISQPLRPQNDKVFCVKHNFNLLHLSPTNTSNRIIATFATPGFSSCGFSALLFDLDNLMVAHRIFLPDGSAPYKAHITEDVLFYTERKTADFEDRQIAITTEFDLMPVQFFDYFSFLNDFFSNPVSSPPGF